MKHSLKITLVLVAIFLAAQVMGLAITNQYIAKKDIATGNVTWQALPYNLERPPVEESKSYVYIISALLIGTGLLLLLVKFKKMSLWKFWFFLSVWITLGVAFAAFLDESVSIVLALILALWKILRPNIFIHNLTELFVYGGLAAIFVPIMNLFAIFILLILISIYDAYAVWKSKHMITLAKFQAESKVFAGLFIPYAFPKAKKMIKKEAEKKAGKIKLVKVQVKNAILGGGDIAFPLLFAGVVLKHFTFVQTLIIPVVTTIALLLLFLKSQKDKFYPAMPFITAGCFLGYGIMILLF